MKGSIIHNNNTVDYLTPAERKKVILSGREPDRMPIYLFADPIIADLAGISGAEYEFSPKAMAASQVNGYRVFGYDNIGLFLDYSIAYIFGATYTVCNNGMRSLERPALGSIDELFRLDLSRVTMQNDKIASRAIAGMSYIQDSLSDEVDLAITMRAPLSAATGFIEVEELLRSLVRKPEKVHELLAFVTDAQLIIASEFIKNGFDVYLTDPIASGSLISPRLYREFALPYEKRLIKGCSELSGVSPGLHICGNTEKVLSSIPETGASSISLDSLVDLQTAKEMVGKQITIIGNIDPVEVMLKGTTEDVEEAVHECYTKAWNSEKLFIIGTGCDLCPGTRVENVLKYIETSKEYASIQARRLFGGTSHE